MKPLKQRPSVRNPRAARVSRRPRSVQLTPELRSQVLSLAERHDLIGIQRSAHLPINVVRSVLAGRISDLKTEKDKLNDELGKYNPLSAEAQGIVRQMGDLNFKVIKLQHLLDSN